MVGAFFKQTAAAFTMIPIVAVFAGDPRRLGRTVLAAFPMFLVVISFLVMRVSAPVMWHFMVSLFGQYRIAPAKIVTIAVELLVTMPLFWAALIEWLSTDAASSWRSPRARWLIATILCVVPMSCASMAKDGGAPNSLLPALVALGAFCIWRSPVLLEFLRDGRQPSTARFLLSSVVAGVLFLQVFPNLRVLVSFRGGHGVAERLKVIEEVRTLPGRVVCPDDPTIPLFAKGYAGRTAVLEADAAGYDFTRTEALLKEISSADYVIVMQPAVGENGMAQVTTGVGVGLPDAEIERNGFERASFRSTTTPVYVLWHRVRPAPVLPGSTRG